MADDSKNKEEIAGIILKVLKGKKIAISKENIIKKIEIPPSPEFGDYSFPCFLLASPMKESPEDAALEIREGIKNLKIFKDIQTKGSYVNFFIDRKQLTSDILSEVLLKKEKFGSSGIGKGKVVMVEFSQANTHKAFHVGHIRGTSLGESISRILEFFGNKVIRANYQGDSGMHVAKWIWCYKKYHSKEKLRDDESWIASIYVDAVKRLEKNNKLQEQVNVINKELESGEDKSLNDLWEKTRELSLNSFTSIYREMNTHFDVYYFEKEMEKRGKEIVESMMKNGFAKKSQDAIIMDLKKYNLGVWVLIRKDGTVLYPAKDLAVAEKKFMEYPQLSKSIYVIASEQNMYFKQLVKTLEITKFEQYDKMEHVSFGLVRLPTGKMSSRTGNNVLYSDFLKKVLSHAKKEIKKRQPEISKKELDDRALKVSIAAIKYDMLKQDEKKNIVFDIKESLNFEGNSGPYIQYSYARAGSILKKSGKEGNANSKGDFEETEMELIKKISEFPKVVEKSYANSSPSYIANYAYQLAKTFNEFYHECPVIKSEKEDFRIALVKSFRYVMKNSLNLLGIDTVDEM